MDDCMSSNIQDTHAYPYSAVGIVGATIGGVASHGSGVLIAADELLTAAHVVFTTGVGAASSLVVEVDLNGSDAPFGVSSVQDFHYLTLNTNSTALSDVQPDFALLHLSQPIASAGTVTPTANFGGGSVHITGYPDSAGVTSMVDTIEIVSPDPQTSSLLTPVATGPGTSGGAVWSQTSSGTAQVFGLVSITNHAAEISAPILQLLNSWIAADHAGGLSGAIAVTVPALLHSITTEAAPAGVSAAEAQLFDTFSYKNNNADVASAGIDPLVHFVNFGWREGRNPEPLFDVAYYRSHNPDVAAAGIDPLAHYANFGWREGRDPSASFSTSHYLAVNADVKLAGINPLLHYVNFGVTEGRSL